MKSTATLLALLAACAGAPSTPEPVAQAPTRLTPSPPPREVPFDAKSWVAEQANAAECEQGARRLRDRNPQQGWEALRACVDRTRYARGAFTHLNLITSGFWDEDLQTRPEAARLIAKIIALRGGDVDGDLPAAQKSRAPVFSLASALRQPDVYKGRWLVVRGRIGDLRSEGNVTTALLSESSLRSAEKETTVGPKYRSEHESTYGGSAEVRTSRYGNAEGKAQSSSSSKSSWSQVKTSWENEKFVTGRQALGRLAQADPFLEPNKDFIFLARFDGVRGNSEGDEVAVISIVSYFQPNALLIE
jgi:hypothetical protein